MEITGFHRENYYLAQIAAEVRRTNSRKPQSVKVEDFVLKFTTGEQKASGTPLQSSKSAWLGMFGIKSGKA